MRIVALVFSPLQEKLQRIRYTPLYNICALLGIVQFADICTFLKVHIELQDMTDACVRTEFVIDVKTTVRYGNLFRSASVKIIQCVLEDRGTSRLEI